MHHKSIKISIRMGQNKFTIKKYANHNLEALDVFWLNSMYPEYMPPFPPKSDDGDVWLNARTFLQSPRDFPGCKNEPNYNNKTR